MFYLRCCRILLKATFLSEALLRTSANTTSLATVRFENTDARTAKGTSIFASSLDRCGFDWTSSMLLLARKAVKVLEILHVSPEKRFQQVGHIMHALSAAVGRAKTNGMVAGSALQVDRLQLYSSTFSSGTLQSLVTSRRFWENSGRDIYPENKVSYL